MKNHYSTNEKFTACGRKITRFPINRYRPTIQYFDDWALVDCSQCLRQRATPEGSRVSDNEEFLSNAKFEIFELFVSVSDEFDGSEYQQGKKDGLRTALALLGNPEFIAYNRGNGGARNKRKLSFPVAMYELERDEYEGAIVLRRGVFERYDNRVAWYITRDVQSGIAMVMPKESGNKSGLFFFHVISREEDISPYLWDKPEDAFEWWEANRERIVAFTSDRLRLRDEVQKVEDDSDGN